MTSATAPRRRIVLFVPHLAIGGTELQVLVLAKALPERGFDPIVVTMEIREDAIERFRTAGIDCRLLERRIPLGLDAIYKLARVVKSEGVSLVHAWLWAANWRAGILRAFIPGLRVLMTVRGLEEDLGPHHSLVYRFVAPLANEMLVNSEAVLRVSAARTGLSPGRYRIVRNGIESDLLQGRSLARPAELDPLGGHPIVGYVGSLARRKRVESLAGIAKRVLTRFPEARFVVVGDGESRGSLEEACRELGIHDRFLFPGYRSDVAPWLGAMSVLVHPSQNEGSSNAVLEAQAVGVPVVAYAISGNRETVLHDQTGILVEEADGVEMSDRICELLGDPSRLRAMGESARAFVQDRFSVDRMIDGMVLAYERALDSRT